MACGGVVEGAGRWGGWRMGCCESVVCFWCVTMAGVSGSVDGGPGTLQCQSITCFEPLPAYVLRLAVMWLSWRSLGAQRAAEHMRKLKLKAWLSRDPAAVVSLEMMDRAPLLRLLRDATRALLPAPHKAKMEEEGLETPPPPVYLRQGNVVGEDYRIHRVKGLHSLACMEVKDGDALILDPDGLVPDRTCFSCETRVALLNVRTFPCTHWVCATCADELRLKGFTFCPKARCLSRIPPAPTTATAATKPVPRIAIRLHVWSEVDAGTLEVRPDEGVPAVLAAAAAKAGLGRTAEVASAFTQDGSRLLRLPAYQPRHPLAASLLAKHQRLLFIPASIADAIGYDD